MNKFLSTWGALLAAIGALLAVGGVSLWDYVSARQRMMEHDNARWVAETDAQAVWLVGDTRAEVHDPEWWQAYTGIAGTIGLMLTLGATLYQLRLTRRTLQLQQVTTEAQNRAYLGVHEIEVADAVVGKTVRVDVTLRNYGQTPAYKVREKVSLWLVHREADHRFDPEATPGHVTIQPNSDSQTWEDFSRPLSQSDLDVIVNGSWTTGSGLLVVGEAIYETFGSTRSLHYAYLFYGPGGRGHMLLPERNYSD